MYNLGIEALQCVVCSCGAEVPQDVVCSCDVEVLQAVAYNLGVGSLRRWCMHMQLMCWLTKGLCVLLMC